MSSWAHESDSNGCAPQNISLCVRAPRARARLACRGVCTLRVLPRSFEQNAERGVRASVQQYLRSKGCSRNLPVASCPSLPRGLPLLKPKSNGRISPPSVLSVRVRTTQMASVSPPRFFSLASFTLCAGCILFFLVIVYRPFLRS